MESSAQRQEHRTNQAYDATWEMLLLAAHCFQENDIGSAQNILDSLPRFFPKHNPVDLKYSLFINAFLNRLKIHQRSSNNLYLLDFAFNQIDLFNLMAEKLPLVSWPTELANQSLAREMSHAEDLMLFDIGIGTAQQETRLLRQLHSTRSLPRSLTIVGLEPSATSLKKAEESLARLKAEIEYEFNFIPIEGHAENLSRNQLERLKQLAPQVLINSAFALHHVANSELKDRVIEMTKFLDPVLFTLIEPDSNHETPDLPLRFKQAWNHYGLVFDVIDQLDMTGDEKYSIKVFFFSREIEDVLAMSDATRTERHETVQQWMMRFRSAGYESLRPEPIPASLEFGKTASNRLLEVQEKADHVSLAHYGSPIVSIMSFTSAGSSKTN